LSKEVGGRTVTEGIKEVGLRCLEIRGKIKQQPKRGKKKKLESSCYYSGVQKSEEKTGPEDRGSHKQRSSD